MERLSDKARMYARAYGQPPYGREIEGTAELLIEMAGKLAEYEDLAEQWGRQRRGTGPLPAASATVQCCLSLIQQIFAADVKQEMWEIEIY